MGLNPEWTQPRLDSTPTGTQPRIDWTQNRTQPQSSINLEYGVQCQGVHSISKEWIKKKREYVHQSISVKKGYQCLNIHEFSSMLKKLETIKMFFTAIEIVPFVVDRNPPCKKYVFTRIKLKKRSPSRLRGIRGWVPFGVKSILCWVPFGVKSILGWVPFGVKSILQ